MTNSCGKKITPKTDNSTFNGWVAIVKQTDDDFLAADLTSILQNFRGAAPGILSRFFREIKTEKGHEYPPKTASYVNFDANVGQQTLHCYQYDKGMDYLCVTQSLDERRQRLTRLVINHLHEFDPS